MRLNGGVSTGSHSVCRQIYIDHFGNIVTGIRATAVTVDQTIMVNGYQFDWARTFSDVNLGDGFWYENANGLVEIAVNQGRASLQYKIIVIH